MTDLAGGPNGCAAGSMIVVDFSHIEHQIHHDHENQAASGAAGG
jgi:hypothetical protein